MSPVNLDGLYKNSGELACSSRLSLVLIALAIFPHGFLLL